MKSLIGTIHGNTYLEMIAPTLFYCVSQCHVHLHELIRDFSRDFSPNRSCDAPVDICAKVIG